MTKRVVVAAFPILLFFVLLWVRQTPLTGAAAAPFTQVIVQANQAPWGKYLGDLDGNGFLDIIEGGGELGGNVYWFQYPTWQRFQLGNDGGGDDLKVADINRDGANDVIVNGSGKIVWYENPRGTGGNVQAMWTKHVVDNTTQSHDIAIDDLNRDGKLDIVIRQEEGMTFYYVQGATADTWTRVVINQSPNGHGGLVVADINRDGRPDIVQNGFWLEAPVDTVGGLWLKHDIVSWPQGSSVAVHDINHDGRLDVFIAVSEVGSGQLSWFEAPVDPVNGTWVRRNIDTVEDVHRFFLVDVNKDGTEDIVFAEMHQSAGKRVGVYYNNGLGASWTLQVLSTQGSHNISVGDIGNDGDIDIMGANWNTAAPDGAAIKFWRNDLDNALPMDNWTYIQADSTRGEHFSFGLGFGDFTSDGRPDIVSGEYFYRNPGGDLTQPWVRSTIGLYDAMLVVDVDDNGRPDVIGQARVGNETGVFWLAPNATGTSWTATLVGAIPPVHPDFSHTSSHGYRLAQVVPGGKPEILLNSETSAWYFRIPDNPAQGNWPRVQIANDFLGENAIVAADMDRDGDLDVLGCKDLISLAWWENPGDGSALWTRHDVGVSSGQDADRILPVDINRDGRLDIVLTEASGYGSASNFHWFEAPVNPETPGWTRRTIVANVGTLNSLDAADIDQDGTIELITAEHRGQLRVFIFKTADGGQTWTTRQVSPGKESHLGTQLVDLDLDGDLDVVSIAWDAYQFLHIWRNNAITPGGGGGPDTTPPVITGVSSSNVTAMSAQINWATNEPADSVVDYGTTSLYGSTVTLPPLVSGHIVPLSGLAPETAYYYRVRSKDAAGNTTTVEGFTFTTGSPDTTPPQITNVTATPLTPTSANVSWVTDEPADGRVEYGPTTQFGSTSPLFSTLVTNHSIVLTGLTGTTTYQFRIHTRDSSGNPQTADGSFTTPTPDLTPPTVSISSPTGGSVVGAINITATAGDNIAVAGVQFYVDGLALGAEDTAAPYSVGWDTTLGPNGMRNLTAVARDASGNSKTSDPVAVTVANVIIVAHRQNSGVTNDGSATSVALAFGNPTAAGSLIVAAVSMGGNTSLTCTDNQGNVYASLPVQFDSTNDQALGICYAPNVKAGATTVTAAFGQSVSYRRLIINEYSGVAQTNPVDITVANIANGTTAANNITTTAGITTQNNTLVYAAVMDDAGVTNIQAGTNFTLRGSVGGSDLATEDRLFTGAGSVAGTFTFGTAHRYLARMVAFKIVPSDPTPPDVAVTAPAGGVTVSGNVQLTATASDNVGVVGLQFKVGGVNAGAEITNGNFTFLWDSTTGANGQRVITAVARDAAGNTRTSADVTVNVNNIDVTPPGFQNVVATGITTTGATITWTTTEPATSQVQYGPDSNYGFFTTEDPTLATSHSQPIGGLSPGTTYFFRVLSADASGNPGTSNGSSFTTPTPDNTPPLLSSVTVTNVTSSSATINWMTNEGGSSQVTYGLASTYGMSTTYDPAYVTVHSQPLTNLQAGTQYHFQAVSIDAPGNTGVSGNLMFTTLAGEAGVPAVGLVSRWKFNETSGTAAADSAGASPGTLTSFACTTLNCNATSGWTTPGRFVGAINLDGTNDVVNAGSAAALDDLASFTYSAWIFPRSLGEGNAGRIVDKTASGTNGFKRFRLNNATANSFYAEVRHSTTNATATSTANAVTLNQWQHVVMTYDGATRVVRIYKNGGQVATATGTGTPQTDAAANLLIGNNSGGSATFNGLIDDLIVYNRALSPLEVQTLASGAPDLAAPQISGLNATGVTANGATLNWNTDELADSRVEYGSTTDYGFTTPVDPTLVQAHAIPIAGLTSGTTYVVRVHSRDSSGNVATSDPIQVTTATPDQNPPTNVAVLTPAGGNVSGVVNVTASASDNVGVASVQYFLDGTTAVSGLLTSPPYTFAWNTATAANGAHALTAVAKDAAGNTTTSPAVAVNVSNASTPVAFVQSAASNNNAGATTIVQAFTSPVTAGSLIVVAVSWGNSSTLTCSDTQGNVYTTLPTQFDNVNDQALGICYAPNAKAGATTVTATFGSSASYRRTVVHEYRGIATVNPVDVTTATIANGTTAANAITTGSVTTTTAGALIFAAVMDDAGTTNISAGTGFTLRASTSSDLASEDRVQPGIGPISGTFTFSNAHRYIARVVAFKPGG